MPKQHLPVLATKTKPAVIYMKRCNADSDSSDGPSERPGDNQGRQRRAVEEALELILSLKVLARSRNAQGGDWGLLLEFEDHDGHLKQWILPDKLLVKGPKAYVPLLKDQGYCFPCEFELGQEVLGWYLSEVDPEARQRRVNHIGWHDDVFVLPERTIYPTANRTEEFVCEGGPSGTPFGVKGSLELWNETVGKLCKGNSRLTFAVSVALAAPLLERTGIESGGFHFHGISSIGKTTALQVAASVCGGGGIKGYVGSWRTTDNALEVVASRHCDCLLALDEIAEVSGKVVDHVSYMLANEQGKERMTPSGTVKPTLRWRILMLSTGEVTAQAKIGSGRGAGKVRAGQTVRVVDIPADAGAGHGLFENLHGHRDGTGLADALKNSIEQAYGVLLPAYLELLVRIPREQLKSQVDDLVDKFVRAHCPPDANGQIRRVCRRFGLVAAAGQLAVQYGLVPWATDDPVNAAATCFKAWLDLLDDPSAPQEVIAGLAQIRGHLERYGETRYSVMGATTTKAVANREGFKKRNPDGTFDYFVLSRVFTGVLCKGFDHKALCKAMADRGFLERGTHGKNPKVKHLHGLGSTRVYHIKGSLLQDPQDEEQALHAA